MLKLLSSAAAFEPAQTIADCRDAKDNRNLGLALIAGAKAVVSGDDDLLMLDSWRGLRTIKPAALLAAFLVYTTPNCSSLVPASGLGSETFLNHAIELVPKMSGSRLLLLQSRRSAFGQSAPIS